MNCIYCRSETKVVNSRAQKRLNQVWRRRQCLGCGAVFTTEEGFEPSGSLVFDDQRTKPMPFNRDRLFVSLYNALSHRPDALEAATALSATILAKLVHNASNGCILRSEVILTARTTLARFDKTAETIYSAYHTT